MSSASAGALVRFKLGSAALTLTVATLGVALPWIFHRVLSERAFRLLSLGNMLSVGVMLGGGLLHLLPEVRVRVRFRIRVRVRVWVRVKDGVGVDPNPDPNLLPEAVEGAAAEGYPVPYLAFSLGLLLPLCVEQLLHAHSAGAHTLLHASPHELKQPCSGPNSQLLVAGPSSAEGGHLRSRRVRGDPHDLSERQLVGPEGVHP